jgi:alcohol dehydrogenase class IV
MCSSAEHSPKGTCTTFFRARKFVSLVSSVTVVTGINVIVTAADAVITVKSRKLSPQQAEEAYRGVRS